MYTRNDKNDKNKKITIQKIEILFYKQLYYIHHQQQ